MSNRFERMPHFSVGLWRVSKHSALFNILSADFGITSLVLHGAIP